MSISSRPLTLPVPRHALLASLQRRTLRRSHIGDFPALALAATATQAELDTNGKTFSAVSACLETLARLQLSVSSAWLLMLLIKRGPQSCSELVSRMKISSAAMTGLLSRLSDLSLVGTQRDQADRRIVIVTATEAARKVLASVVALTELGAAASILTQTRTPQTRR